MDFRAFINSDEIKNMYRENGYSYSSLESAWLVYSCEFATVSQKHRAWKWIIDNMLDDTIYFDEYEKAENAISLHKVLEEFIEMENDYINYFTEDTDLRDKKVYIYHSYLKNELGKSELLEHDLIFSSWDNCKKYMRVYERSQKNWEARVSFTYLDGTVPIGTYGYIIIDPQFEIKSIYSKLKSEYIYEKTQMDIDILNFFQLIEPDYLL